MVTDVQAGVFQRAVERLGHLEALRTVRDVGLPVGYIEPEKIGHGLGGVSPSRSPG